MVYGWFIISFFCLLIDQIIKLLITSCIPLFEEISIVPHFFYLTHLQNTGAAWSVLEGNVFLLIGIAILSIGMIYTFFIHHQKLVKIEWISYGILIGGILGNLVDRIIYGHVIDYLEFHFGDYTFPIFNFADICIVISVALIILQILKGGTKHEKDHHRN